MKTNNQLLIDLYIAKPIAFILNFFVRFLGKILNIDHSLNQKFKRIAICKFKGLGSVIQATPMIIAIKQLQPDAEIIFVTTKSNQQFVQKIDLIDSIIVIDDKNIFALLYSLTKSLFKLIRLKPDVYIDLEIYSNFSTLVTLFSLSKNRIGFYLRSSSFRMGIYTHMMFFNSKVPIFDVYLQIARLFGEISTKPSLYSIAKNCKINPDFLPKKEYVVINPNASDLRIERRWNMINYRKLILKLAEKYPNIEFILIGNKTERIYVSELLNGVLFENVHNWAGKTDIDQLILLIQNSKLIITNDTGPMHIAFACKTPAICLFGPCNPEQYALLDNAIVIYKKVYCSPCVHDFSTPPCKGNNVCMQLISVEEVFEKTENFIDGTGEINNIVSSEEIIYYENKKEVLGFFSR